MQYKRNEYFRYTFGEPTAATFRLIKEVGGDQPAEFSNKGNCHIVDISPNGLRMVTELSIAIDLIKRMEISFVIDETPLNIMGELVWCKKSMHGFEYGVRLVGDQDMEQRIINELKSRRRKEVENKSKNVTKLDKK
ncbi:MAG: PilZ domain-containing protein [Psychrobacillus sp.]